MHYTISKAQIEQTVDALLNAKEACATSMHFGVDQIQAGLDISDMNDVIITLRSLLTQPNVEDDGSDWFCKLKFICRVLDGTPPEQDKASARDMARSLFREKHAAEMAQLEHAPAAFTPISAADITDEIAASYRKISSETAGLKADIAHAVNAYHMESKK